MSRLTTGGSPHIRWGLAGRSFSVEEVEFHVLLLLGAATAAAGSWGSSSRGWRSAATTAAASLELFQACCDDLMHLFSLATFEHLLERFVLIIDAARVQDFFDVVGRRVVLARDHRHKVG